jgi:hypothetical protein
MLGVPFAFASSSIAASLIWHGTISPSFIIVNANAKRSLSCPKIWPRVNGIETPIDVRLECVVPAHLSRTSATIFGGHLRLSGSMSVPGGKSDIGQRGSDFRF